MTNYITKVDKKKGIIYLSDKKPKNVGKLKQPEFVIEFQGVCVYYSPEADIFELTPFNFGYMIKLIADDLKEYEYYYIGEL